MKSTNLTSRSALTRPGLAASKVMLACVLAGAVVASCSSHPLDSESERSGWKGTTVAPSEALITDGHRIAQRECASCHSIDKASVSSNLSAPPLRDVLQTNDPDFLAYRLIDAMRVGHDAMPLFDFDARSADALVAYIKSISE